MNLVLTSQQTCVQNPELVIRDSLKRYALSQGGAQARCVKENYDFSAGVYRDVRAQLKARLQPPMFAQQLHDDVLWNVAETCDLIGSDDKAAEMVLTDAVEMLLSGKARVRAGEWQWSERRSPNEDAFYAYDAAISAAERLRLPDLMKADVGRIMGARQYNCTGDLVRQVTAVPVLLHWQGHFCNKWPPEVMLYDAECICVPFQ